MMCSLVSSDLARHQMRAINYIKEHENIKQIVFTGHSLAGGMATLANVFVRAKLDYGGERNSPWLAIKDRNIDIRTLSFAPPMTMFDCDEVGIQNNDAEKLLQEVSKSTRGIVFGCDVVPRGYAYTNYIHDAIAEAIPDFLHNKLPLVFRLASKAISSYIINNITANIKSITDVAVKFRHLGTILYYADENEQTPKLLTDAGPMPTTDENHFFFYDFKGYGIRKDAVDRLYDAHLHFPECMASHISVPINME